MEHSMREARHSSNSTISTYNNSIAQTNRTLSYWDDLLIDSDTTNDVILSNSSAIVRVQDVRIARILSILPSTQITSGVKAPATSNIYIEAAGFLAMHHFNQRSGQVLPDLPQRLQNCNVYLTINLTDSSFSPIQASRIFYQSITKNHTKQNPKPVAVLGDFRSSSSLPLSMLTGSFHVPHMSCASTSSALENKDQSPTFMRTVPTNAVDAHAVVVYMAKHLQVTRLGVLFIRDAYGTQFTKDLTREASSLGMKLKTSSFDDGDVLSIRSAVAEIYNSGVRFIFAIVSAASTSFKILITEARNAGIMSNSEYSWHFGDGFSSLLLPTFYNSTLLPTVPEDRYIAEALSGIGVILLSPSPYPRFDQAMADFGNDGELYNYYISRHDNITTFQGFNFAPKPSLYQYTNYDAVMSLGIALCDSKEEFINDEQMLQQVKSTEFDGVSGHVTFDSVTGTRTSEGLVYNVRNVLVSFNQENQTFDIDVRVAALIEVDKSNITIVAPFVFAGGSLVAPSELPPLEPSANLVPIGIQVFMWTMTIAVILTSIGFAAWTFKYRKRHVVRSSQPFFLVMLCCGTFLMGTSIIPMSLQEPLSQSGLDIACMATPWLFVLGLGTSSSSLLCKSLRINHLFHHSKKMRRKNVTVRDVIYPFVLITCLNVTLLICWTVVAPSRWVRSNLMNLDKYGRSVESIGRCDVLGSDTQKSFVITLLIVNFIYILIGNYQCYRTRMMPADFNETSFIALSMASILESLLIGVPIIFLSKESPKVDLMIRSILVTLLCFAILLPLFVSKFRMINVQPSPGQGLAAWKSTLRRTSDPRNGRGGPGSDDDGRRSSGVNFKSAAIVAAVTRRYNDSGRRRVTVDSIQEIRARVAMANDNSSWSREGGYDMNDSYASSYSNLDGSSRVGISWSHDLERSDESSMGSERYKSPSRHGGDSVEEIRARAAKTARSYAASRGRSPLMASNMEQIDLNDSYGGLSTCSTLEGSSRVGIMWKRDLETLEETTLNGGGNSENEFSGPLETEPLP